MPGRMVLIDDRAADLIEQMYTAVRNIRGGPGVKVTTTGGAIVIALDQKTPPAPQTGRILLGEAIITGAGADASHWAWKYAHRNATTGKWEASTLGSETCGECVIADALPGVTGMCGLLCWQMGANGSPVFSLVPFGTKSSVTVSGLVTGNASGNGKYTGKSFADVTADVSASGNLSAADFGTLADANDCLILNPVELNKSTTGHDVTATNNTDAFAIYFTGRLAYVNSDGTKVIHAMLFYAGC